MSLAPRKKKPPAAPCRTRTFDAKTRLEEIAEEIRGGADPESFIKEMDKLLGTEMPPRRRDVEECWEQEYRQEPDE